jgi:hypothetical protein
MYKKKYKGTIFETFYQETLAEEKIQERKHSRRSVSTPAADFY